MDKPLLLLPPSPLHLLFANDSKKYSATQRSYRCNCDEWVNDVYYASESPFCSHEATPFHNALLLKALVPQMRTSCSLICISRVTGTLQASNVATPVSNEACSQFLSQSKQQKNGRSDHY
jgi:hypothetical protein